MKTDPTNVLINSLIGFRVIKQAGWNRIRRKMLGENRRELATAIPGNSEISDNGEVMDSHSTT